MSMVRFTAEQLITERKITSQRIKTLEYVLGLQIKAHRDGTILVWRWLDAPGEVRAICCMNGGDEDWVVVVEKPFELIPPWVDALSAGGIVDEYTFNGITIYVGSHS